MIFLSVITNKTIKPLKGRRKDGEFYIQYKYLLKSINKIYPNAIPILYVLEGDMPRHNLENLHKNVIVVDYRKQYKEKAGMDTNKLIILKNVINEYNDHVVLIDTDCLVIKKFDEYLNDDVDITNINRGETMYKNVRQDICFGVFIFHKYRLDNLRIFIDRLILMGKDHGAKTKDWWNNIQPMVTKIYHEAGIDTSDASNIVRGDIEVNGVTIKAKAVPSYVLGNSFRYEKNGTPHPDARILHYKTSKPYVKDLYKLYVETDQ